MKKGRACASAQHSISDSTAEKTHIIHHLGAEQLMFNAYGLAARPIIAWSIVTALGFLALTVTPYWAAKCFGILVSSAVLMGTFGDLIFMQSLILTFPGLGNVMRKKMEKTAVIQA